MKVTYELRCTGGWAGGSEWKLCEVTKSGGNESANTLLRADSLEDLQYKLSELNAAMSTFLEAQQ